MGDLFGDADYKLIIATPDKKMRVWKGIQVISELTLVDVPVAIECFYIDANVPSLPCVAVCSGSFIYVYRVRLWSGKCVNPEMTTQAIGVALRPFCKLTLPPLDVNSGEQQVCKALSKDESSLNKLRPPLFFPSSNLMRSFFLTSPPLTHRCGMIFARSALPLMLPFSALWNCETGASH